MMGTFPTPNFMLYEAFVGATAPDETLSRRANRVSPNEVGPFALLVRRFSVTRRSNRGRVIARHRARVMAG